MTKQGLWIAPVLITGSGNNILFIKIFYPQPNPTIIYSVLYKVIPIIEPNNNGIKYPVIWRPLFSRVCTLMSMCRRNHQRNTYTLKVPHYPVGAFLFLVGHISYGGCNTSLRKLKNQLTGVFERRCKINRALPALKHGAQTSESTVIPSAGPRGAELKYFYTFAINLKRMITTILEILKYTIPAVVVLIVSYLIVQKFLVTDLQRKQLSLLKETQEVTLRLRLQAYERLALLMERIQPSQLLSRVYQSGLTVKELQQLLTMTIKSEFEHNLAQQLYVSKQLWQAVKTAKDQELNMIHEIARRLDPSAPAKELHRHVHEYIMSTEEESPSAVALHVINDEAKKMMSKGTF